MIHSIRKIRVKYNLFDKTTLFDHLSVGIGSINDPLNQNISNNFTIFQKNNWELFICFIIVIGLCCAETLAVAAPHMSNTKNNWVQWTLAWELVAWVSIFYYLTDSIIEFIRKLQFLSFNFEL